MSEDIRVKHNHDRSGQPDGMSKDIPVGEFTNTLTVEEQRVPAEHRDIEVLNADDEFNCANEEENGDFNIPGMLNSTVKRSQSINIHSLIERIENHPQRGVLEANLQPQHRPFVPFSKESQEVIKAAGNIELCEIVNVVPKVQCKECLAYCDAGLVYCKCGHFLREDMTKYKKYIKAVLDLFSIPNFYIRKNRPHGYRYGKKVIKNST